MTGNLSLTVPNWFHHRLRLVEVCENIISTGFLGHDASHKYNFIGDLSCPPKYAYFITKIE